MGQLVFQATLGGQVNLVGPNTASTLNINVPAFAGTMASLASVTNNGVTYVNSSGQPTTGTSFVFDGTNVGIGTSSPNSKLTSQTATTSTSVFSFATQLNNSYASNSSIASLGFHSRADVNSTGVGGAIAFSGSGTSDGSGSLVFCIKPTGNIATVVAPSDEKMRIDNSGNVGIGTSSPDTPLTFAQSVSKKISLYQGTNWHIGMANYSSINVMEFASDASGDDITFGYGAAGSITRNVTFKGTGNVGIGTSSPAATALLDVQSTTKGVRFPNMTTTQKTAITPSAGTVVFDTTLSKLCVYSGAAWQTITSV